MKKALTMFLAALMLAETLVILLPTLAGAQGENENNRASDITY